MKKSFFLFVSVVFIFTINSFSQSSKDSSQVNSLIGGRWAIQFELGSFINPNFFESVMFSLKPQLSRYLALRFGVSYDFRTNEGDEESNGISFPDESRENYASVKANLQYYINPKDNIVFYIGLGPMYRYTDYKSQNVDVNSDSQGNTYSFEYYFSSKSWSAGVVGLLGVEWFLHHRISFLGEYNITAMFGKYQYTSTRKSSSSFFGDEVTVSTKDNNTTQYNFNIAKVGVSVYF